MERAFGPYLIEVDDSHAVIGGGHAVIRRADGQPVEPTFYEMQYMKHLALGGPATAVEIFPAARDLIDGQNQRHLWKVDRDGLPNLTFDTAKQSSAERVVVQATLDLKHLAGCRFTVDGKDLLVREYSLRNDGSGRSELVLVIGNSGFKVLI